MNAKISAAILARINAGQSLPEAMDAVLGAGSYMAIVSNAYTTLRASK